MSNYLNGKTAFITGAAGGLGLSLAEDLADKGVNVCGTDIRYELLKEELARISDKYKVETMALKVDVSDESDVVNPVEGNIGKWGKIDILINNAGIRIVGPLEDVTTKTWSDIQDTNLKGQFLCTREVLKKAMIRQNEGVIIFLSSDAGKQGEKDNSVYCASKWGALRRVCRKRV
jgi:NADP-dependent 3-hydroxy acid dehydrogenase YdfG